MEKNSDRKGENKSFYCSVAYYIKATSSVDQHVLVSPLLQGGLVSILHNHTVAE